MVANYYCNNMGTVIINSVIITTKEC